MTLVKIETRTSRFGVQRSTTTLKKCHTNLSLIAFVYRIAYLHENQNSLLVKRQTGNTININDHILGVKYPGPRGPWLKPQRWIPINRYIFFMALNKTFFRGSCMVMAGPSSAFEKWSGHEIQISYECEKHEQGESTRGGIPLSYDH